MAKNNILGFSIVKEVIMKVVLNYAEQKALNNAKNMFKSTAKFLDQPALVKKLHQVFPLALASGAVAYGLYDTHMAPDTEKKDSFIKNTCVLSATVLSALVATRGLKIGNKQIFEGLIELPHLHLNEINSTIEKISDTAVLSLVKKAKNGEILSVNQITKLSTYLDKSYPDQKLIDTIVPPPHLHKPFSELKQLSLLGLFPVLGGIVGGIGADKLISPDWKKNIPNKIKEGTYQYLNNIFLCNVGAGAALMLMNKYNVKSKPVRFFGMLGGVIGVGLVAGSAISNFVSKNFLTPLFAKKNNEVVEEQSFADRFKNLNEERHPEAVDLCLHVDDLASVGFLNGIKWVAPVLPLFYSVSGYRAGVGYRNHSHSHSTNS